MTSSPPTPSEFFLNGRAVSLHGADPHESLLRWLRRERLTGTKEGCADGDCGACTVALVDTDTDGKPRYQAVNSCLLPVGQLVGRQLLTVEALSDASALHPVQQALVDCAGSQCGYCTPGFVMSLFVGQQNGELSDATTEGNLCRCTGYRPIRQATAVLRELPVFPPRHGAISKGEPVDCAPLPGFFLPDTLAQALALKQAHPEARWLAGATDLGVDFSRGRMATTCHIALDRIADLQQIVVDEEAVLLGAGVSLSRIESELHGMFPALDSMLHDFAARQVKNRATLGGNLGTASPIGDLLPVLLALDAEIECVSATARRWLPIDDFFIGYRQTRRRDDELIRAVRLPRRPWQVRSAKVAKRATDDISIVAAAFALGLDGEQRVQHLRLAYGGVAATPLRARRSESLLLGQPLNAATIEATRASLHDEFTPLSDARASADYRRALIGNLFVRFVREVRA